MGTLWRRLRARDPHGLALRRAARAAVVVPVDFAIGSQLIGNAQVATFAAFGSFALLLFANFSGGRLSRTGGYAALAVAGAVLITIGTLVATPDWLAVVAMAVVALGVLFAGVTSSMINGATQAALLAFILAVLLPGLRSNLPDRLAGWGIAVAVSVPVALFVWPPEDRNVLRLKTAALCRALSVMLRLEPPPPGAGDPLVAMRHASTELREAFRVSATSTAALSTGTRLLIRLVDELEWLTTVVSNACADAPAQWPEQGQALRASSSRALAASAEALTHDGDRPRLPMYEQLDARIADLDRAREAVAAETLTELRASAARPASGGVVQGEFERPLYAAHELGYAVALAARTVAAIAAADSRPWWARFLGRRPAATAGGAVTAASRHLDRHSVWLQNSVRGAAGLALAVLFARVFDAQNAFWIGLGALSVLRSTALSTGATIARALAGTVVGFAVGGGIVELLGTGHALLWTLLPVVILVAGVAPAVISFVAGQAAFTVFSIILFNLIAPAGWRVGVLRVEDVALGCAASLVAGVLLWPRGAGAALGTALAEAYRTSAGYLRQSVEVTTGRRSVPPDTGDAATAAGSRLDDALRQYLAERGTKQVPLQSVAALANGAARLRLAGTAIARLQDGTPSPRPVDDGLAAPLAVLDHRAATVGDWYVALADAFTGPTRPPGIDDADSESFLEVVLPAVGACGDSELAAQAERVLWSGQYLGDVDRIRTDLLVPADQVRAARSAGWWRR